MKYRILLASLLAALGTTGAFAQTTTATTVQRDVNQEKRIEQGVQSGSLTNHEAGSLERGQAGVDRKEAQAARNGHINKHEQAAIQGKQNRQSEELFEKKHNDKLRKG